MKRASVAVFTVALCVALPSSATDARHVQEKTDPYTHVERIWLEVPTSLCRTQTTPNELAADVRLVVNAFHDPDGRMEYALAVDIDDNHLMHVGTYATMDTATDDHVDKLHLAAERTKWSEHSFFSGTRHVREVIPFTVDRDFLMALASAKTFQFRVDSRTDQLERCSSASDLQDLHGFLKATSRP